MRGLKQKTAGFTLVELLIVIMIIGILLGITLFTNRNMQTYSDDVERASDVDSIARRLEQSYANQEMGTPSYPSTAELIADAVSRTGTMKDVNADTFSAPGGDPVSIVAAGSTSTTAPYPDMTPSVYVYQPQTADGSLCTKKPSTTLTADNCVRFTLYYKTAIGSALKSVRSVHQQ